MTSQKTPPSASPKTGKKPTSADFETRIEALEKIIEQLKSDDLPLDESLKQFENGMRLAQEAQKILDEAEQKIRTLTKDDSASRHDEARDEEQEP